MQTGTVKFYNESKGYGFIKTSNGEVFVHSSGLIDQINEDDEVQFEIEQGQKGPNAVNVEVVK